MTLSAQRRGLRDVEVQANYGPINARCTENYGHVRGFWTSLGLVLDQIDAEVAAERAASEAT